MLASYDTPHTPGAWHTYAVEWEPERVSAPQYVPSGQAGYQGGRTGWLAGWLAGLAGWLVGSLLTIYSSPSMHE